MRSQLLMRSQLRRIVIGAPSLALATLLGVGGLGLPAAASSGGPPDPQLAQAVAQWVTNGGETELMDLATDFKSLETSAKSDDMPSISLSCTQLGTDVENAQAYDPIPDPQAQHDWADALDQYALGATDCVSGANNSDVDLITQASVEITTGSTDLSKVTARLNEIAG